MKKILMLMGTYLMATLTGALVGVAIWPEPSRLSDVPPFMFAAPLFQLVAAFCSLTGNTPGPAYTGAHPVPRLLLFVCLLLAVSSVVWYWRTQKKWSLLVLGVSVVLLSLPGTNMLYAAIAM